MRLQRKEVIDELAKRSGFFKNSTEKFIDALESMLVDVLSEADIDESIEIQVTKGFVVGATKKAAYTAKDPRNQNDVVVPERIMPYAKFTQTFKQRINE